MPELPEVQTIVDDLIQAGLVGRTITGCRGTWPRTVAKVPVKDFCRRIAGRCMVAVGRRGKFVRCDLSGGLCLLIHLRMTGRLVLVPAETPVGAHEHVRLRLDDGRELRFHDPRKFGRMWLTDHPDTVLHRLGPEPLGRAFTARALAGRLAGRRRALKPLLLDQGVLAGLGNIYVDEALWQARLHPLQPAGSLSMDQVRALHRAVRQVLRRGLANGGTSLGRGQGNFSATTRGAGENRRALKVFRRTGKSCPRCGATIRRLVVGQRSTHVCPHCQRQDERAGT
jgi:formamidopyrimidine-DNA glycosylase